MVSIVVPAYNEHSVIRQSYSRLSEVMKGTGEPYEIIFVNDGSIDDTGEIIKEIAKQDENIRLLDFSRNFGHQVAISAGMDYATGDAVVVIDADLQDPPEVIPQMIEKWQQGFEVVYGKRVKRKGETFFKKYTASLYYRFLRKMTDMDFPVDTGDFRLIDRKVCDVMRRLTERNRYVRGLVTWVGFSQTNVEYIREARFAGETKYPLKKMIKLAVDGLLSFSYKPLTVSLRVGILFEVLALGCGLWLVVNAILGGAVNTLLTIFAMGLFFSGILLVALGIVGEYLARMFDESKNRPLYVLKDTINFKK